MVDISGMTMLTTRPRDERSMSEVNHRPACRRNRRRGLFGIKGRPVQSLIRRRIQRTMRVVERSDVYTSQGKIMRIPVTLAAAFGLCLVAAGPALADGGGGGNDRPNTTTCSKGEVW